MKLYLELLIGVAVGASVYVLARAKNASEPVRGADGTTTAVDLPQQEPAATSLPGSETTIATDTVSVARSAPRDARAEHENRMAMNALKNAIITSTSEDMHRRGTDLLACTRDLDLAGTEKLRFSVHVDSSKSSADYGPWRFDEIVDGEALPASFAPCAQRALGQGGHVKAGQDLEFPQYEGDVELVYTIPAP
jgi:hypothetical protein